MARTKPSLDRDKEFNPSNQRNIHIKLTASDTDMTSTITMPKQLVTDILFPCWGKKRIKKWSKPNSVVLVDLFEYDSKITTALTMKRDEDGNFKFYGWKTILDKRNFKTGDIIGFWWDNVHKRLNFELLSSA